MYRAWHQPELRTSGCLKVGRTHVHHGCLFRVVHPGMPSGSSILAPDNLLPLFDAKGNVFNLAPWRLADHAHQVEVGLRLCRTKSLDQSPPRLQPVFSGCVVGNGVCFGSSFGAHKQPCVHVLPKPLCTNNAARIGDDGGCRRFLCFGPLNKALSRSSFAPATNL